MDTWHGTLLSAIAGLVAAVGALWKENKRLQEQHRKDLREMYDAATRLGTAVTERLARLSEKPAPGLTDSRRP